jgi:major capsid protein E
MNAVRSSFSRRSGTLLLAFEDAALPRTPGNDPGLAREIRASPPTRFRACARLGTESALAGVQSVVNQRFAEMGQNLDLTLEHMRLGALRGRSSTPTSRP